jgi:DNA polymerase
MQFENPVVVVDFETYYATDFSLRKIPIPEYIRSPRFKVFGAGVYIPDENPTNKPRVGAAFIEADKLRDFLQNMVPDRLVIGHNLAFDGAILEWHYGVKPLGYIDTLSLANHVLGPARTAGSNSLASLATVLGLEPKGDLAFLKGVEIPDAAQMAALAIYATHDAELTWAIFNRLMPYFSNPEFELTLANHTLEMYLRRPLTVDLGAVAKGQAMAEALKLEALAKAGVKLDTLMSGPKFAEALKACLAAHKLHVPFKVRATTDTEIAKAAKEGVKAAPTKRIPAMAKGDEAFLRLLRDGPEDVKNLINARLAAKSSAPTMARFAKLERAGKDVGVRVNLHYYGAHTGRFSGGGGFNFQNLTDPKKMKTGVERDIAKLVRSSIVAGPRHSLASADASQVECRVEAWMAGEDALLAAFRANRDIYSEFISDVLQEDIRKPTPEDAKDPEKKRWLEVARGLGKIAVLGLGYQMGVAKFFKQSCSKSEEIAIAVQAGTLPLKLFAKTLDMYRRKYTRIVAFWDDLDTAFRGAAAGLSNRVGPLTFGPMGKKSVFIELPSTRRLYYRNVRSRPRTGVVEFIDCDGNMHKSKAKGDEIVYGEGNGEKVYGGLLAENVTQAVSRDLLAEAVLDLDEQFPVVLHVHDSIVCRVPEGDEAAAMAAIIARLSTAPAWGEGLPLAAEGKFGRTLADI